MKLTRSRYFAKSAITMAALSLALATQMRGFAQESEQSGPANVQDVGFKYEAGKSRVEIQFDKQISFDKSVSEADKQVIIDIKNAKIAKKWGRRIDASQHKSNISMISPYQSGDLVRVVLQLKSNGGVEVSQDGTKLVAYIDNKAGDEPAKTEEAAPATAESAPASAADQQTTAAASSDDSSAEAIQPAVETSVVSAGGDENAEEGLGSFFKAQKSKSYVGKKIFLQVRDAELTDVFRIISEASEFNIVLSEQVKGKIMLNLTDVPWDQALDLILHTQHLAAERHGNVLRVTTLEAYTKEKEAEFLAIRASQAAEPLVVKIFPISYAKIDELKKIVTDFLTKEAGAASAALGSTSNSGLRGSIQIDTRTNSLIVRDTASTIEKVKRIIKELDTQTPQILIEGKFVEVAESTGKSIQGRIFATSREVDSTSGNFVYRPAANNFGSFFGSGFDGAPSNFAITPINGGASFGFSPKAGLLPGFPEISAFLSILESETSAKVIASPRVVAQNKEEAEISQGQTYYVQTVAGANSAGTIQQIDLLLKLKVVPQVTNDGSITMKLSFSQDSPGTPPPGAQLATDKKKIESQVTVDSGATLVIGGIYSSNESKSESGIPLLRDLPLIGNFFGSKQKDLSKRELFIFLTPRVINEKESGLKG